MTELIIQSIVKVLSNKHLTAIFVKWFSYVVLIVSVMFFLLFSYVSRKMRLTDNMFFINLINVSIIILIANIIRIIISFYF